MAPLDFWHLFMATVEGRESRASSAWTDTGPSFVPSPIPRGTSPDLKLLAEMLRSKKPLPPNVRAWLADLVDPEAGSEFQFKSLSRRGRGPGRVSVASNWDAAEAVISLMQEGSPRKRAIGEVMDRTGLRKSTLEAAMRSRREAQEEHARLNREHTEIAASSDESRSSERIRKAASHVEADPSGSVVRSPRNPGRPPG